MEGQSDGEDHELVAAYEEVGLTWWVEKLGWFRGSVDFTRKRIEQGPPGAGRRSEMNTRDVCSPAFKMRSQA
jgi:hypothetical protein